MSRFVNSGTIAIAGALGLVIAGATSLVADGLRLPPATLPAMKKECSACHMLYPPGLLPARSWRAMMSGLGDHFGDNAELDAQTTKALTDYLVANAADAGRGDRLLRGLEATQTPARITDMPWWTRKHEKKARVAPATLARKGAAFKGDCKACHKGAEQGVFEED